MKLIYTLGTVALLASCNQKKANVPVVEKEVTVETVAVPVNTNSFTASIEKAHNTATFKSKKAIQYDIDLVFGGKKRMDATITQMTDGTKINIAHKDGKRVAYDGKEVFAVTADSLSGRERFNIFTWTYFFAFPHKLSDPGTNWSKVSKLKWGEVDLDTAKLTFGNDVGDSPKDWYVVYKNAETNLLAGASYIVTFSKDVAKAEEDPHAVKYNEYAVVDGVQIPISFTINNWNKEEGYLDELGEVKISNIKFVNPSNEMFAKPDNAVLVDLPSK